MNNNRKGLDLMQFIGKKRFNELVAKWEMGKSVREVTTWELTGALITCLVFLGGVTLQLPVLWSHDY